MALLIIFIIWYNIWGRSNPKTYRSIESKLPKIFGTLIAISVFSSLIPHFLFASLGILLVLLGIGGVTVGPVIALVWMIRKMLGKDTKPGKRDDYTYYRETYQTNEKQKGMGVTVTGLSRSVPKRRKIIQKFSRKYALNLTEKEVDRIVDASYMSNCWEREIYDMSKNYDTVYQWYSGETGWLRAYLRAFPIQSVSSDFEMQRNICVDSFDQIFREADPGGYTTIDECVDAINNRFLTAFDETTFMIAFRFLEQNGRHYPLPHLGVIRNESPLEQLKRKYDEAEEARFEEKDNRRAQVR